MPEHVVIIPDGNRRWAKQRGLNTLDGHLEGVNRIKEILSYLKETEVKVLTVWCFSTENWNRSEIEVKYLMKLLEKFIDDFAEECLKNKIQFRHLGRKDRLNKNILEKLQQLEEKTKENSSRIFNLAFDYGGRDEILRAVNQSIKDGKEVDEKEFSNLLDTKDIQDPDLIIRTSGEQRTSGMMPWQSVYSELYFTDKFFPDFGVEEFKLAMEDYSQRKRRFGK